MAQDKSKSFQKKIQETEGSGFGTYAESVGGGKPFDKGDSNTRTTRNNGKYRKEHNKTMQPRTADGKFSYASLNGKQIDPKYGPSRGRTINPLLTGGVNGIKIDDVEEQFSSQSGKYWDKYKNSWYRKSGELITRDLKTRVAGAAIWDVAKRMYDEVKGEFQGESELFKETKKGRKTLEEAKATAKAKESDEQQFVIKEDTGSIKEKDKLKPYQKKQPAPTPAPQPTPKAPEAPAPQPAPAPAPQAKKELEGIKYGKEQVQNALSIYEKIAQDQGTPEKFEQVKQKFASLTPEQLDKQLDFLKSKGLEF